MFQASHCRHGIRSSSMSRNYAAEVGREGQVLNKSGMPACPEASSSTLLLSTLARTAGKRKNIQFTSISEVSSPVDARQEPDDETHRLRLCCARS